MKSAPRTGMAASAMITGNPPTIDYGDCDLPASTLRAIFSGAPQSPWGAPPAIAQWSAEGHAVIQSSTPRIPCAEVLEHQRRIGRLGLGPFVVPVARALGLAHARGHRYTPKHVTRPRPVSATRACAVEAITHRRHTFPFALAPTITSFAPPTPERIYLDVFGPNAWVPGAHRIAFAPRALSEPWKHRWDDPEFFHSVRAPAHDIVHRRQFTAPLPRYHRMAVR